MNPFHLIILSLVEGITEFLPISSTAHLILTARLLNIPQTPFLGSFEIAIQLGAILAVAAKYARFLLSNLSVILKLIIAMIPTGVAGVLIYPFLKHYLLGNALIPLIMLGIGGIILILFETYYTPKRTFLIQEIHNISCTQSFLIGLAQSVAIIPGVSRSAATVLGGMSLGIARITIIEFSFLLALPTMAAATGLDLLKTGFSFSNSEWRTLMVGMILSGIIAFFSMNWLLTYVKTHDFKGFGYYRIIISLIGLTLLFM